MHLTKKQVLTFLTATLILAVFFTFVAEARQLELNYPNLPGLAPLGPEIHNTTLPQLLVYLYTFFVVIGGLIAFGSIVFAGFLFMASGANPPLRNQAKNRIQQAVLGLVLLLGAYIVLSTINPELVLLHAPAVSSELTKPRLFTEPSGVLDTADFTTLRYGGAVVFEQPKIDGSEGRSETILHDVANFETASYIDGNNQISAIKILGPCTVKITDKKNSTDPRALGQPGGPIDAGEFSRFNNNVKGLSFDNKSCLGHSIKVFENKDYNAGGVIVSPRGGTFVPGAHTLLTNALDLRKVFFTKTSGTSADNKIRSLRFSFDEKGPGAPAPLSISLCEGKGYASPCASFATSTPVLPAELDNKASSIRFDSREARQAGVIVYRDTDFSSHHEIFIASDANLKPSIVGDDEISSLQIIGKYRVTFYEKANFDTAGAWLQFDNTDPESPKESSSPQLSTGGAHQGSANRIFGISDLAKYCFLKPGENVCTRETFSDKISSIKIELPSKIMIEQNIFDPSRPLVDRCDSSSGVTVCEL